jgi:hypothetical protein
MELQKGNAWAAVRLVGGMKWLQYRCLLLVWMLTIVGIAQVRQ